MSLKFKIILIASLAVSILALASLQMLGTAIQVEKKTNLFVPATGYLLGIAEVNAGITMQAKEALDYLVTDSKTERAEFSERLSDVQNGFKLWIESAQKQSRLGVPGEEGDIETARQIKAAYLHWVKNVEMVFDLVDAEERSLALEHYEQGALMLLEEQILNPLDRVMEDGFDEVESAYHELLLAMHGLTESQQDEAEIINTTHAAIDNVINGCRVNLSVCRQFSVLVTYLLTGKEAYLERYEELKVKVRGAIDDWFLAAYQQSIDADPELSKSVSHVSKVVASLEELLELQELAIIEKKRGNDKLALQMVMDETVESPIGDHLPLMVFSALKTGSSELVDLTSLDSRWSLILLGGAFLGVLLLTLNVSKRLLRAVRALREGMDSVSRGNLLEEIYLPGNDELARLAHQFNQMSTSLYQSKKENEQLHADLEKRVVQRTAELAKVNSELEAYNSAVSHDLRNPLSLVNGYAELMLMDDNCSSPKVRDSLGAILKAGKNMEMIIDSLLDLSRMDALELEPTTVNVSELAKDVLKRLKVREPERQVYFKLEKNLSVEADKDLLQIALENLLGNAWKYSAVKEKAEIELGSYVEQGRQIFYIKDNGAGFDMSKRNRLFTPFQRLHSNSEFEGTGVGLATVQRILRCHGGDIWAEGEIDKGATFNFTFEPTAEYRAVS